MKALALASALALGITTSAAMAAPAKLTDAQMDNVTAGLLNVIVVTGDIASDNAVLVSVPVQACLVLAACFQVQDNDPRVINKPNN